MKRKLYVIVIIAISLFATYAYRKPITFSTYSTYLILGSKADLNDKGSGQTFSFPIEYKSFHQLNLISLTDYESNKQIDPPYLLEDENSNGTLLKTYRASAMINLLRNSHVSFSKLSYKEHGKEKTTDIGNFYMELTDKATLSEQDFERIDGDERSAFKVHVTLPQGSVMKDMLCVNSDINPILVEMTQTGETCTGIISYDLKDYKSALTNMIYTIETNGEVETRYGTGFLYIEKGGVLTVGGLLNRESSES